MEMEPEPELALADPGPSARKRRRHESDNSSESEVSVSDDEPDSQESLELLASNTRVDPYNLNRTFTISVAVAGTVIDNASTPQLKALLCGQIARAVAIFNVDEVIVFNDKHPTASPGCEQLALILQYLECPQYLRKSLFPLEANLSNAGLIPPLALPHHFCRDDVTEYRDGVIVKQEGKCDWVNVGLRKNVHVNMRLEEGLRVTVKLDNPYDVIRNDNELTGQIVSPNEPRKEKGLYWGYKVRQASTFQEVLDNPDYENGYDMIIGTSDKGNPINDVWYIEREYNHLLVLFGGVDGLESISTLEYEDEAEFLANFHYYLNVRPAQGTRTIRTEEAIPITLTALAKLL